MHTVTKTYGHQNGISTAFRQWRAESHCAFVHGYALAFEFEFGAHTLNRCGWVVDFGNLKDLKRAILATFDHKLVYAADDPNRELYRAMHASGVADVVELPAVGCEAFAAYVAELAQQWLDAHEPDGRVCLLRATVKEHGANSATYFPE